MQFNLKSIKARPQYQKFPLAAGSSSLQKDDKEGQNVVVYHSMIWNVIQLQH